MAFRRRVTTRKGEPVYVKLANDIHVLLSVLEGDDYSLVKDLLSTARGRSTSQIPTKSSDISVTQIPKSQTSCQCNTELAVFRDSISSIQADLLLMKQRNLACEKLRADQLRSVSNSLVSLKSDVSSLSIYTSQCMADSMNSVKDYVGKEINSKLSVMSSRIETVETQLGGLEYVTITKVVEVPISDTGTCLDSPDEIWNGYTDNEVEPFVTFGNVVMPEINGDKNANGMDVSELEDFFLNCAKLPADTATQETALTTNTAPIYPVIEETVSVPALKHCHTEKQTGHSSLLYSEAVSCGPVSPEVTHGCYSSAHAKNDVRATQINTKNLLGPVSSGIGIHEHIKTRTTNRHRMPYYKNATSSSSRRGVTFAEIIRTIGTPSAPRIAGIPVRITHSRDVSSNREQYEKFDEEDFISHVRKRTKHFFVGGFKNSITSRLISSYVNGKGLKVSMVKIFPTRRTSDDVIIRVNVEANGESSQIVEKGFWPRGVFCKPWLSRSALSTSRNSTERHTSYDYSRADRSFPMHVVQNSNTESYNKYRELSVDID